MRLEKIKIYGFKSFVDPTVVGFTSNLTAIVGPNGCGKSNIIDAVKWVMGESSAKTLRGESMSDVIFNGARSRKPVGVASVELIFNNQESKLGGRYAGFNEIAIKRMVSRDGISQYHLNGSRCRRRDITDIFLGTGLGSRSYAIIEQGMVSKLIEAKPQELRKYLEEAAGISKYKERRQESENRIQHTQENLNRLNDLRQELHEQLNKLKRQSEAAKKYQELKQQQRRNQQEYLALCWKGFNELSTQHNTDCREKEAALDQALSIQREQELRINQLRDEQNAVIEKTNTIQEECYQHSAQIIRLEAEIKHSESTRQQQQQTTERLQKQLDEIAQYLATDNQTVHTIFQQLQTKEPRLQQAKAYQQETNQALAGIQVTIQTLQQQIEDNQQILFAQTQAVKVSMTQIEHIQRYIEQRKEQYRVVEQSLAELDEQRSENKLAYLQRHLADLTKQSQHLQHQQEKIQKQLANQREKNHNLAAIQSQIAEQREQHRRDLAMLQSLQSAALDSTNEQVLAWLQSQGLANSPRMAKVIEVEPGWELALEAALGQHLEAFCVEPDHLERVALDQLTEGRVTLVKKAPSRSADSNLLLSKVKVNADLSVILDQVYIADTLQQARTLCRQLPPGASVVTKEGIYLGQGWAQIAPKQDQESILQREQGMRQINKQLADSQSQYKQASEQLQLGQQQQQQLVQQADNMQHQLTVCNQQLLQTRADLNSHENIQATITKKTTDLNEQLSHIQSLLQSEKKELQRSKAEQEQSRHRQQLSQDQQQQLIAEKQKQVEQLAIQRVQVDEANQQVQELAVQIELLRSQQHSVKQQHERLSAQQNDIRAQLEQLQTMSDDRSLDTRIQHRDTLLQTRQAAEQALNQTQVQAKSIAKQITQLEQQRHQGEQAVQAKRVQLEQARQAGQAALMRCQIIDEQLDKLGQSAQSVLAGIDPKATEAQWEKQRNQLEKRITGLGPINLQAIDEYQSLLERKNYLDKQNDDLVKALQTLQTAIVKIDQETGDKFKATFEQTNANMKAMFPRFFGGGQGHLQLTGNDLLQAGIVVMARPPGKQNSSIHLLSGGEKAMTAVALLFSFFQLNPAPFCMLDEIDASLDDVNVGRFCDVVKGMSTDIGFVVVTHNKNTMGIASQLLGVTMQEPGVSRLVSVDIDEAVKLAS